MIQGPEILNNQIIYELIYEGKQEKIRYFQFIFKFSKICVLEIKLIYTRILFCKKNNHAL